MSLFGSLARRAIDLVDASFDTNAALWRVVLRGAFAPDAKSYRGGRFSQLSSSDVFVQEIALNAEDANEARRAIALDPDSALPLAADTVVFDVAGPIAAGDLSARPERRFALGVVRRDALERLRGELPFGRRGSVEGFVFTAPVLPNEALVFQDEPGRRRRRVRRLFTAAALALFLYAGNQATTAGYAALDRVSTDAQSQRTALERRIHLAERHASEAEALLSALARHPQPRLADVSHQLVLLARNQSPDSALNSVAIDDEGLALSGAAYSADNTELALRRTFESARVTFSAEPGVAPAPFQARIAPAEMQSR